MTEILIDIKFVDTNGSLILNKKLSYYLFGIGHGTQAVTHNECLDIMAREKGVKIISARHKLINLTSYVYTVDYLSKK